MYACNIKHTHTQRVVQIDLIIFKLFLWTVTFYTSLWILGIFGLAVYKCHLTTIFVCHLSGNSIEVCVTVYKYSFLTSLKIENIILFMKIAILACHSMYIWWSRNKWKLFRNSLSDPVLLSRTTKLISAGLTHKA